MDDANGRANSGTLLASDVWHDAPWPVECQTLLSRPGVDGFGRIWPFTWNQVLRLNPGSLAQCANSIGGLGINDLHRSDRRNKA
uniref:Uncharacterized protein n=1 Tax=Globodera rostochiensis TaxID=31243 RepID=A0A914I413_GLORO